MKDLAITDPVAAGKAQVAALEQAGRAGRRRARAGVDEARRGRSSCKDIGGIDFTVAGLGLECARARSHLDRAREGRRRLARRPGEPRPGRQPASMSTCAAARRSPMRSVRRRRSAKLAALDKQLTALDADLAKFKADASADPAFVKQKQSERDQLAAQRETLKTHADASCPRSGSFFTLDQIRINKALACSVPTQDKVKHYDVAAGEANVKAAAGRPVPPRRRRAARATSAWRACARLPPASGRLLEEDRARAGVADARRSRPAVRLRVHRLPRHRLGQAGRLEPRRTTTTCATSQCEVCHGPASIHVAKGGNEKPAAVDARSRRRICARPTATRTSTPTRSSTRRTCATSSARATARICARSSATARPATSCARPRSTRPAARSEPGARDEATLVVLVVTAGGVWRDRRGRRARREPVHASRRTRCSGMASWYGESQTTAIGRAVRQARDDRGAPHAAARHAWCA